MKRLSMAVVSTLALLMLTSNAFAFAFLEDWVFNPFGTGAESTAALTVPDFLNVLGETTAINIYSDDTNFTFEETADFTVNGYGLPNANLPLSYYNVVDDILVPRITAEFIGSGTGTTAGSLIFDLGTLSVAFDGIEIGLFTLIDGYANLDGQAVPNGDITTIFEATSLAANTWFDSSLKDLSTVDPQNFVLGFATTNATLESSDLVGNVQTLVLGNNGQFRLAVVPEPSTFLLLGAGLLGIGFIARRKEK